MAKGYCFICGKKVTAGTDSKEHLFQNSIGGRRKVGGFLHEVCNNKSGEKWDAALAAQLNPLCLFLGITRERGFSPSMRVKTTAGEDLALTAGGGLEIGDPNYEVINSPEGPKLKLHARNKAEARLMLEEVKQDHFPQLDTNKLLRSFPVETSYPEGAIKLSFEFGGRASGPAMVKTAAAFAHSVGVDTRACELAVAYLRDSKVSAPFGYFDDKDLVRGRQPGLAMHVVAVTGDPKTGMLLGYVEYFSVIRIIVGLSHNYVGTAVHRAYAMDPITGKDVPVDVEKLIFSPTELKMIYSYERTNREAVIRNFAPVMDAAMKRQFERERDRVLSAAIDYGLRNCGAKYGEILTQEQLWKLSGLMAQHMQPWLLRRMVRRPPPGPFPPQQHQT